VKHPSEDAPWRGTDAQEDAGRAGHVEQHLLEARGVGDGVDGADQEQDGPRDQAGDSRSNDEASFRSHAFSLLTVETRSMKPKGLTL
jgi:hypothetical protein